MPPMHTPIEQMTPEQLRFEIQQGARFVQYQYCISLLVITLKRFSAVTYVPPNESSVPKGIGFTLISLLAGWWGIPWGPIWTIQSIWVNCSGGKDLTPAIAARIQTPTQAAASAA